MKFTFNSNYTHQWKDEFLGICFMPQGIGRFYSLSKSKLLAYFSELNTLYDIHTFILDHLSKIEQVNYYMETSTLVLKMNKDKDVLELSVPLQTFEDILINCTIKQLYKRGSI